MPLRIKIPLYAKNQAKKGLQERKGNNAGLSPKEARELGVYSGVARANQLVNNKYLDEQDARSIARFYSRFKNQSSKKSKTALRLWGGRKFGRLMNTIYYNN